MLNFNIPVVKSIAFIDTQVPNYQSLVVGVTPGTEVVVLDAAEDAIDQITDILALRTNIDSIHIISHGAPGCLQLGKTRFSLDNLETYSQQLQRWRSAFTDSADILIYGCNVASKSRAFPRVRRGFKSPSHSKNRLKATGNNSFIQSSSEDLRYETGNSFPGGTGEQARNLDVDLDVDLEIDGFAFIQRIAQLTNANVAASKNLTGSAAKGGDWKLEARIGEINTPLVFGEEVLTGYAHILPIQPYEFDLKTGTSTSTPNQFITLLEPPTDSNGDSWLETLVKIDFQGLTSAKFIVDYGTTPSGWTVNIGDSVSNNGFGGDGGDQNNDAEMQIVNGNMAVFGNDYNTPPGAQILQGNVPNFVSNGSRVELEVSNQKLAWNNNNGLQNSLNSPYLYALAGQPDATGTVNSDIYASFNRIIDGSYRVGSGARKVTIILDPIEVNFGTPSYSGTEGTTDTIVNIPVTIDSTPNTAVTVPIVINPSSTATKDLDYTFAPTTVTFAANTTTLTQNVAVTIKPDNIAENAETAIFSFGTITGSLAGAIDRTTLTIAANGQVSYGMAAEIPSIPEGNTGTKPLTFTATRSGDIGGASSVNYAIAGTATNGSDYNNIGGTSGATAASGTINFAAGETSKTITLDVLGDAVVESDETIAVALSNPVAPGIAPRITAATATTTIANDDKAGINVIPLDGNTSITEGGVAGTYALRLTSQPTAPVTISLNAGDRINPIAAITFDSKNWNVAQKISVSAIDDNIVLGVIAGTITYAISSADANYNSLTIADITIPIGDNDRAGVSIIESAGSTEIGEGGATDTYSLVLTSEPVAPVTINFNPGSQINAIAPVTFTPNNWNVAQNVTVSAIDDNLSEGTHSGTITHTITSTDANYNDLTIPNVTASIADNNRPGVSIVQSAGSTEIGEGGATDTYSLVLTAAPTAPVTINLDAGSQISAIAPVTFTLDNWNVAQNVTVSAIDDSIAEGTHSGTIAHKSVSDDTKYNNLTISPVTAAIADNDTAGVTISPTSITATEGGASGTYNVKLSSQPAAPVTVSFANGTQINAIAPITFDASNWNVAKPVTVTATDDAVVEGSHAGAIGHTATGVDTKYNQIAISGVAVAIADNDTTPTPITRNRNPTPTPTPTLTPTPAPEITPTPTPTPAIVIPPPAPTDAPQTADTDCICRTIVPPDLNQPNQVDDTLYGNGSNINQFGTRQNDAFYGSESPIIFNTKEGNDNLYCGNSNDTVNGNEGNDFIVGNQGNDWLFGGKNNDIGLGGEGEDIIFGNRGRDSLNGREDDDYINGNESDDWMDGGKGNDSLFGGKDNDLIVGSEGNDTLLGHLGDDTLCGGQGDDYLRGDRNNDLIDGGEGNDRIYGGEDDDTLIGCEGDDVLSGDLGNDTLTGGLGVDRFLLSNDSGIDTITDFEDGKDLLILGNKVTFSQLAITQSNGITQISFAATGQVFASLIGVSLTAINAADFSLL
jgi:Ca2+-binding RTX toxin-like protein